MIISSPTGLYANVLANSGNVTYVISNQDPPRSMQQSSVISIVQGDYRSFNSTGYIRRSRLGEQISSKSVASASQIASNGFLLQVGDVLEFVDDDQTDISPSNNPPLDIRHDLNVLDYEMVGLSAEDISVLKQQAYDKFEQTTQLLNEAKQRRQNVEASIVENQRHINEANKVLLALEPLGSIVQAQIDKVTAERNKFIVARDNYKTEANDLRIQIDGYVDQLRNLSQLVR